MLKFNGNKVAKQLLSQIRESIQLHSHVPPPSLGIILIGDSAASQSYVNRKLKACTQLNIHAELYKFNELTQEQTIREDISRMREDAILVQLPLPGHMDRQSVIQSIPSEKDVDCLHMYNMQKILLTGELNTMLPCTPAAVLNILDYYDIDLKGKRVTVIGRSLLVGMPLSLLLMKRNATVTVCHRETQNLQWHIENADIVISAAGSVNLVRKVKQGAIVIDVGINRGEGHHIVGDVDFEAVSKQASIITPVPGGVGPMTVCMLMRNIHNLWCSKHGFPIYVNQKLGSSYLED